RDREVIAVAAFAVLGAAEAPRPAQPVAPALCRSHGRDRIGLARPALVVEQPWGHDDLIEDEPLVVIVGAEAAWVLASKQVEQHRLPRSADGRGVAASVEVMRHARGVRRVVEVAADQYVDGWIAGEHRPEPAVNLVRV